MTAPGTHQPPPRPPRQRTSVAAPGAAAPIAALLVGTGAACNWPAAPTASVTRLNAIANFTLLMPASFSRPIRLHIRPPSTGTVDHNARLEEIVPDGEVLSGATAKNTEGAKPAAVSQASGISWTKYDCQTREHPGLTGRGHLHSWLPVSRTVWLKAGMTSQKLRALV
jgi:hypothetical protein